MAAQRSPGPARADSDDDSSDWWVYATTWMLVTADKDFLEKGRIREAAAKEEPSKKTEKLPLWTDDFASVYSIMKQ